MYTSLKSTSGGHRAIPHTDLPFPDRLAQAVNAKDSRVCVGLDPRLDMLPEEFARADDIVAASVEFCRKIIDAVADVAVCVKPQAAYFEALAPRGLEPMWEVVSYAKKRGLLTIVDAKRSDIGSTAEAYARACFGQHHQDAVVTPDAVTVNPYLGTDGVRPFIEMADEVSGGLFVLVKTSNESSGELQDLQADGAAIYEHMADLVTQWGKDHISESGYSTVGAVVGATYPKQLQELRERMSHSIFLVPGYGFQGGGAEDVAAAFDENGFGAVVNSSRGVIYAYRQHGGDFQEAAFKAAQTMREDINTTIG
ncbi:MAG: orotidine-5'-phosphate decarboxylase [Armatimonadota bacterium]